MKLEDAQRLAWGLMEQYEYRLGGWSLTFDNAKRRCGCTKFSTKTITLSRHFVRLNGEDEVRETVLHEIAHVIAAQHGDRGHGRTWKAIAAQIGAKPERCASDVEMPEGNIEGVCADDCKARHNRHRMPPKRLVDAYQCTRCGDKITWIIVK